MKAITTALCALCIVTIGSSAAWAQCDEWTANTIRNCNGYDYELWNQGGANVGTVNMKITGDNGQGANARGGTFSATWSGTENILFRSGKKWSTNNGTTGLTAAQHGNISIDFEATWSSGDNVKMLGVYGWAHYAPGSVPTRDENGTIRTYSNQIEYYIIQDRGTFNPASQGTNAKRYPNASTTFTIDGIEYQFWVADRINQPMLTGNGNFKQYFSVPVNLSSHRTSGIISVSRHFEEWVKAGMLMDGPLYEVAMKVESYTGAPRNSQGSATVTRNLLTIGGNVDPKNYVLTTNVTPAGAGTITSNPNASSYAPGTPVTLTRPTSSDWIFSGWIGGGCSGTGTTCTVIMNQATTVTATYTPSPDANLVRDGNFPGTSLPSTWSLNSGGTSSATSSVSSNRATINISNVGTNVWEPQLVQQGISLVQGRNYRLTFDASAVSPRVISAMLQQSSGDYTTYTAQNIDLTATQQSFTLNFTMTAASDPNAQLAFNFGQSTANVTISNVRLADVTGTTSVHGINTARRNVFPLITVKAKTLTVNESPDTKVRIRVVNLTGKTVASFNAQGGANMSLKKIPAGAYIIEVTRMRDGVKITSNLILK
jgi:hypothetical protein